MSRNDDALDRDDARFVERLRESYAPEPLAPARRAAFDAALRERLEGGEGRRAGGLPALGALAAAVLAVVFLLSPGRAPDRGTPSGAPLASEAWVREVLYEDAVGYAERLRGEGDPLPPQHAAIAGVFLAP
jgi:hypothetical protein